MFNVRCSGFPPFVPSCLRAFVPFLVFLLILTSTSPLSAQSFSRVVAFGDSLTDTGNIFDVTSDRFNAFLLSILFPELDPPIPGPPYFDGRFSNGPVWVEHLSSRWGLGPMVPSENGGFNYAVGGAKTFNDGALNLIFPVDVVVQVDSYLNSRVPAGDELFVVEGGANDLLSGGVTDVTIPAGNLATFITALYNAGGRNFLVPNLPPLGQIPSRVGGPNEAILDARSIAFNNDLATRLNALEQTLPDIEIFAVDFFGKMQEVLATPGAFGFTNIMDAAYNETTGTVVPNPNAHLFWDDIHPTARAHRLLGLLAAASIPEPGGTVLFIIAAATSLARRRRP